MKNRFKSFLVIFSISLIPFILNYSPKLINISYEKIYYSKRIKKFLDKLFNYNSSLNYVFEDNAEWDINKQKNKTFWHDVVKEYIPAENYLKDYFSDEYWGVPGGYIDYINEELIIGTNGVGEMFKLKSSNNKISKINSNLEEIYKKQAYKGVVLPYLRGRFGTRDIFVDRVQKDIYVSIFVDVTGKGCYGMGIYKASYKKYDFNIKEKLIFNKFFHTKICNSDFSGHASGGRIQKLGKDIIFTVGDFDLPKKNKLEQLISLEHEAGKIISINDKGEYKILSKGHRNQQGLLVVKGKIFSSEHGPKGGDEINTILKGRNYGWPYFAYGTEYDGKNKRFLKRYRTKHKGTYKKPLFYFTPSLGISELIFYNGDEFYNWKGKIILSSLKNKSLYFLDIDMEKDAIISNEKYYVGNRIRDLIMMPSGKLVCITDDQKIIYLKISPSEKYKNNDYYFELPENKANIFNF